MDGRGIVHFEIREIEEEDTYELRRRVSADGIVLPTWHHELDETSGARYLGVVDADGRVVASASLYPVPFPALPRVLPAVRLMFMGVEPRLRRRGLGTALMDRAVPDLRARNVRLLWATARDVAIPFYRRFGFQIGEPLPPPSGLRPHSYIYLDLLRGIEREARGVPRPVSRRRA